MEICWFSLADSSFDSSDGFRFFKNNGYFRTGSLQHTATCFNSLNFSPWHNYSNSAKNTTLTAIYISSFFMPHAQMETFDVHNIVRELSFSAFNSMGPGLVSSFCDYLFLLYSCTWFFFSVLTRFQFGFYSVLLGS